MVATATTDSSGRYRFDVFGGLRCGNYQVRETVPSGWGVTSANPRTVNIPRGETFLDVDFGNVRTTTAPAAPPGAAPGSGATAPVPSVSATPSAA